MTDKHPFAIDVAIARIREAIRPFPRAALFALAEEFSSPFELLVACIISIRTLDAVTLSCAYRLFAQARTPLAMSQLTPAAIDDAIHACTFHEAKAPQIHAIACRVVAAMAGYCRVTPRSCARSAGLVPNAPTWSWALRVSSHLLGSISMSIASPTAGAMSPSAPLNARCWPLKPCCRSNAGGDQPSASAVWQAYLHGQPTALLLPGARHVPATRGPGASLEPPCDGRCNFPCRVLS